MQIKRRDGSDTVRDGGLGKVRILISPEKLPKAPFPPTRGFRSQACIYNMRTFSFQPESVKRGQTRSLEVRRKKNEYEIC